MNVPKTIRSAETKLTKLGGIVTASEWERAAIVFAFTEVADKDGGRKPATSSRLSPNEFAELGIIGLKSKDTVRKYHVAWQDAIDAGEALPIGPGDVFNEPELDFPPVDRTARQAGASVPRVASMLHDKENIGEVIAQMPIGDLIPLVNAAQAKIDSAKTPRPVKKPGPLDVMVAISDMDDALDKLEKAEPAWTSAVKEGTINKDVYEEEYARIEIIQTLMQLAGDSESFEMEVPRS